VCRLKNWFLRQDTGLWILRTMYLYGKIVSTRSHRILYSAITKFQSLRLNYSELKCLSARRYCKPMKARKDGTATCSKGSWTDAEQKKHKKVSVLCTWKKARKKEQIFRTPLPYVFGWGPRHPVIQSTERNTTDGSEFELKFLRLLGS
jgi:hypothetical protein